MARPEKTAAERRTVRVEFRLTADEEKLLLSFAENAGLTVSDYIRRQTLNAQPLTRMAKPERAAMIRALAELGKVGSNVNQIARAINRQLAAGQSIRVPDAVIQGTLNDIRTLSDNLIKSLADGH